MKPKSIVFVWVFLLLTGIAFRAFPQQFIQTNAAGGIFSSDQQLIFALSEPGWLRIIINGIEIYRGIGPAYPELGVPWGEERSFWLTAEYFTPDNVLVESLSWYIFIDKRPPDFPDMEFRNTEDGLRLILSEDDIRIRAWADVGDGLVFFPDLARVEVPPADSFQAMVWAEDMAGNSSEPRPVFFQVPAPRIENPVPGQWRNPQMLIISGAEEKSVYWTADGSDPLAPGGTGRLYQGPQRINREGPVTLRVAWRDSTGRAREYTVEYLVTGSHASTGNLYAFFEKEETEIRYPVSLSVPGTWLWSMGGAPRHIGGESITLRPERLVKRTAALHLSAAAGGGIYRFVYLLDGTVNDTVNAAPMPALLSAEDHQSIQPLSIISAGRSRVISWPRNLGTIFFSWEGMGPWQEGRGPFPVPLEGGTLRWFALNGETGNGTAGPYTITIAPLPGDMAENVRGRIGFRVYGENRGWNFVSALLEYTPGMVTGGLAVCDGEDIEWAFISAAGEILERARQDRLAPGAPRLAAFPEGGWARGPVTVSVITEEEGVTGYITARLRYASGVVKVLSGTGSLDITSSLGEAAEVTVEGRLVDMAGNHGPKTVLNFIIDPKTIFASSQPLMETVSGIPPPVGGKDNPFTSLQEALDYAVSRNINDILIAGTLELREPVTISTTMRIEGSWKQTLAGAENADNRAILILGDDFFWNIQDGAELTISGVRVERENGDSALMRVGTNGKLTVSDSVFTHSGPFLVVDRGTVEIEDSTIFSRIFGEQRTAAFSARQSEVQITNSRMQIEGNYGLVFNIAGGTFSATDSVFLCAGRRTATVFVLSGTRGNFENLTQSAAARDYASVMEAFNSELSINGGTMGVSARDTSALLLDNSPALLNGARILVEGAFTARALEIRGIFPGVKNCRFYSTGSARRSEVFSGMEEIDPPAASLTDNSFSGFTHIHGRLPAGRIAFE